MWIVLGIVAVAAVVFFLRRGSSGAPTFPPGTRAWEAQVTMEPLLGTIADRAVEHAMETDPVKKARLEKDIEFFKQQVVELQAVIDSKDLSPGQGYIGFKQPPRDS